MKSEVGRHMIQVTISLAYLIKIRRLTLRRGIWHRVLNGVERALVSLTIRCVKKIRSLKLAEIVAAIVDKLRNAMKTRMEILTETVGRKLAQNLSLTAKGWGYAPAVAWVRDPGFTRYLAIIHMNTFGMLET